MLPPGLFSVESRTIMRCMKHSKRTKTWDHDINNLRHPNGTALLAEDESGLQKPDKKDYWKEQWKRPIAKQQQSRNDGSINKSINVLKCNILSNGHS